MKKLIVIYFVLVAASSTLYAWDSCSDDGRMYTYNSLNKKVTYLLNSLSAFSPKEEQFFDKARIGYFNGKKKKFERIINSNDYAAYSNSKALKGLQGDIETIIKNLKKKNLEQEIKTLFSITMDMLDNLQFSGSYLDSKYMLNHGIVNKGYSETAQRLSWDVYSMNLCGYSMVKQLQRDTK